jgi:hypothetical protein
MGELPMHPFAPVDTFDTSTFLRGVVQPGGGETLERILLPVTGLENNGQPVTPKGFGSLYGLFLTIDATAAANSFTSMNVTLWADPKNDARNPGVSETSDPAFANGMANDIILATGTMVSASLSLDPATGIRHGDFVQSITPTLDGTLLLHGSIQPNALLHEQLTTPPSAFQSLPQPDGSTINLVTDGAAQVTLGPQATILVPNISHANLRLALGPTFMHGKDGGGQHGERQHGEGRGRND